MKNYFNIKPAVLIITLTLIFLSCFEGARATEHYVTCTCNTQDWSTGFCSCGDGSNRQLTGDTGSFSLNGWQTDTYQLTCNGDDGDREQPNSYAMNEQPANITCTALADITFHNNQADFQCTNWNFTPKSIQIGSVSCKYAPPPAHLRGGAL